MMIVGSFPGPDPAIACAPVCAPCLASSSPKCRHPILHGQAFIFHSLSLLPVDSQQNSTTRNHHVYMKGILSYLGCIKNNLSSLASCMNQCEMGGKSKQKSLFHVFFIFKTPSNFELGGKGEWHGFLRFLRRFVAPHATPQNHKSPKRTGGKCRGLLVNPSLHLQHNCCQRHFSPPPCAHLKPHSEVFQVIFMLKMD